jgi:hypothetical protein
MWRSFQQANLRRRGDFRGDAPLDGPHKNAIAEYNTVRALQRIASPKQSRLNNARRKRHCAGECWGFAGNRETRRSCQYSIRDRIDRIVAKRDNALARACARARNIERGDYRRAQ